MAIEPEKVYNVGDGRGEHTYAVTPDGLGCYWYNSLFDAQEEHGDFPVVTVRSEKAFEILRGHDG